MQLIAACLALVLAGRARGDPGQGYREVGRPLSVVSDIGQHLSARGALLQAGAGAGAGAGGGDARLPPLPSAQELETIRKVAQILVMLGEQVIPSLINGSPQPPRPACDPAPGEEVPNDPVAP